MQMHGVVPPPAELEEGTGPKTVDSLLDRVSMNSNADGVESGEEGGTSEELGARFDVLRSSRFGVQCRVSFVE